MHDSMIVRNARTAFCGAAPTPASSVNSVASQSEIPCASAYAWRRASVESPIPRRGRFAMRWSETASYGLSITWRYATRSFTSARS